LTSGKSAQEVLATLGRKVKITPKLSLEDGINAARMVWPRCWFDETKTARGLECLQNYRRELNAKLGEFRATPVHDWASHGAEAFRYLAVAIDKTGARPMLKPIQYSSAGIV
jgi:phage terminase large subunit